MIIHYQYFTEEPWVSIISPSAFSLPSGDKHKKLVLILKKSGLTLTTSRIHLLHYLMKTQILLTAYDLSRQVNVSLSTTHRNLSAFGDFDLVDYIIVRSRVCRWYLLITGPANYRQTCYQTFNAVSWQSTTLHQNDQINGKDWCTSPAPANHHALLLLIWRTNMTTQKKLNCWYHHDNCHQQRLTDILYRSRATSTNGENPPDRSDIAPSIFFFCVQFREEALLKSQRRAVLGSIST